MHTSNWNSEKGNGGEGEDTIFETIVSLAKQDNILHVVIKNWHLLMQF